jgi:hypothetical protein
VEEEEEREREKEKKKREGECRRRRKKKRGRERRREGEREREEEEERERERKRRRREREGERAPTIRAPTWSFNSNYRQTCKLSLSAIDGVEMQFLQPTHFRGPPKTPAIAAPSFST